MTARICQRCKKRKRKAHLNSKWCHPCAEELKHRPKGTLTSSQRAFAVRHAGDMTVAEIAKKLKTSAANVKRSCRDIRFHAVNGKYKERPELVRQVLDYYFENGRAATAEAFPHVNVKCIVDRPEYYGIKRQYRQIRWTDDQLVELARMAGIVSMDAQWKWFNRPGAHKGSVRSVWSKRFGQSGGTIHGMSHHYARHLVTDRAPYLITRFWETRRGNADYARKLCLWIDMEKHLKPEAPNFIRDAVKQMAEFQRWLFRTKNPKRAILRMVNERELS